jgi:phosphoribosylaminoimidazolecarboxamide formyltransferase/IMP cyclohydrolase
VSDKRGLEDLGRALDGLGFELVSTGGTARGLRGAGLVVTEVASVTGAPEMLDGRVKTLHPAIHGGILADLGRPDHRVQLALRAIEPFELVVVNLYPFAEAASRPGVTTDELIEEIDVGGPALVRAAAKNHASLAVVTRPEEYPAIVAEMREQGSLSDATRRRLALEAFRHTAAYDARIAEELSTRLGAEEGGSSPGQDRPSFRDERPPSGEERFRARLDLRLERIATLRYGENPHQAAALYRGADGGGLRGAFAAGITVLQGKALSYNNILDAAAAVEIARDLRGVGCVIVKHTNPCGAAEAADLLAAWERALAGDPVSAFGGVVAVTRAVDGALAERLASLFLEVVVAPAFEPAALERLAERPNLRLIVESGLAGASGEESRAGAPAGVGSEAGTDLRTAAGAVLVMEADRAHDDPGGWTVATRRGPSDRERADLDLAWRIVRHVKSNAIVLVRDAAVVGVGAGQMSRVDSARIAIMKAGAERAVGAACASDAFFPFPDGVEACTQAGVTAIVQPGGSQRDAEVVAAADAAGAAMLFTGRRHFRH